MNILSWMLFGLIAGLFTTAFDEKPSAGEIIGTIILGILGAVLGGLLASTIFGVDITGFSIQSFLISALGSVILLFLSKSFRST